MEVMTMNGNPDSRGTPNAGSTLLGFALGAVVGAGLALLLAPDSGKRTRERLASTAARWNGRAAHGIEQARDAVAGLGADARSALKAGQDAFLRDRATRGPHAEPRPSTASDATPHVVGTDRPSGEEHHA
jgi:gas vesicle protein